jgi:hypothetical protein
LDQGNALNIPSPGVLANDTDVNGDSLTATLVSGTSHGQINLNSNGSFNYTPVSDYSGTDTFTYKANDGKTDSNTGTVTLTVIASSLTEDPPTPEDPPVQDDPEPEDPPVQDDPITADTFGLDDGNRTWSHAANMLDAMRFLNDASTGTLTKLELQFDDASPAGKVRLGVYADNNGLPGSLLLDAGEATVANGWVSISLLNLPVTGNTYYWLVFSMDSPNAARYMTGQPSRSHYWISLNYGALPSTINLNYAGYNSSPYVMRATVVNGDNITPTPEDPPVQDDPEPEDPPVQDDPITADTFGLDDGNRTWSHAANMLDAMRFLNDASTGTLTKLELQFDDASPAGKVRLGVYADNNGLPGSLLLDAGEATVANGWVSISLLNLPVTGNTYYWLVFSMDSPNAARYMTGQPSRSHYWISLNYGALPSTINLNYAGYNSSPYVMRATVE